MDKFSGVLVPCPDCCGTGTLEEWENDGEDVAYIKCSTCYGNGQIRMDCSCD